MEKERKIRMSGVDRLVEGIGETVKHIPEFYNDGLKSSTQETGKTLALIPRTINAALAPLRKWIAEREYSVSETERLLAIKLEGINAESIVSPEAYVAVPVLQAISYCKNSEELRNMYANLLATSMVENEKENAHPSFVEIIKQLSPDEAKLLKRIDEEGEPFPLIDVRLYTDKLSYVTKIHNFTLLAEGVCDYPNRVFEYIDNLVRLMIIEIPAGVHIKNDDIYKPLESYEEIKTLITSPVPEGYRWEIKRSKFDVTQYGRQFLNVCVKGVDYAEYSGSATLAN